MTIVNYNKKGIKYKFQVVTIIKDDKLHHSTFIGTYYDNFKNLNKFKNCSDYAIVESFNFKNDIKSVVKDNDIVFNEVF